MKLKASFTEMKRDAIDSLSGFWGTAFVILFVMGIVVFAASFILVFPGILLESEIYTSITEIIICPFVLFMSLGLLFCMLKFSRNDIPYVRDLFRAGRFYPKYLLYSLIIGVFAYIAGTLLGVLIGLAFLFIQYSILISILFFLLTLAGAFWLYVLLNGFTLIPYLIIDNPKMKISRLFKMSWKLMKGNKIKLLLFQLSFLGWELLCLLPGVIAYSLDFISYHFILNIVLSIILVIASGIGFFFLSCYFSVSQCNFYNQIIIEYKEFLASSKQAAPDTAPSASSCPPPEEAQ